MQAKLVRYYKSEKHQNKTVIVVSNEAVDDYTGVVVQKQLHYIVVSDVYFKDLIGNLVELELVKSEKLGFEVCTSVKLVQQ